MSFQHTGTLPLETKRLLLRKFEYHDADSMLSNWIANPNVQHHYGEPTYETKKSVQNLIETWISYYQDNSFYRWAIILKRTQENIGQIAFCRVYSLEKTAEVEYCIGKTYWGNGYAEEALLAVLKYTFENSQFQMIEAFHVPENIQSKNVLKKVGMKQVDSIRRFQPNGQGPNSEICYAMTIQEYYERHIF